MELPFGLDGSLVSDVFFPLRWDLIIVFVTTGNISVSVSVSELQLQLTLTLLTEKTSELHSGR